MSIYLSMKQTTITFKDQHTLDEIIYTRRKKGYESLGEYFTALWQKDTQDDEQ